MPSPSLWQQALAQKLGTASRYATPIHELETDGPLDQGEIHLSASSEEIAQGLDFDPEKAQYDTYVERMGKGFMSYGKSRGKKLNFLENIWRKGVRGYKAQRMKGMPDFKMTGSKKDVARKQEIGDSPGVAADVYRGAQERRDRPVSDWTGNKISPANYHPTKGWLGYERDPGSTRLPKNRK